MSSIVNIETLPDTLIDKLDRDLRVQNIVDPRDTYAQRVTIQAWDRFAFSNRTYACIPLSYFYHHCSHIIKAVQWAPHVQHNLAFQGELLARQQDIKNQTLDILQRTGSVLLCLHTGFGKTIFTLYLCSKIGLKVIVLCHRSIIIQQWLESIARYLPTSKVAVLSTAEWKKKGVEAWKDLDILVCNVINVPKLPRTAFTTFGTCVVDEVHTICTKKFSKALQILSPSYSIGLSATPYRSDGMDRILELYFGPEIVTRRMHRFFNAYKLNTKIKIEPKLTVDGKMDWNSVLAAQSNDVNRNILLCKLVYYFCHRNILVLVKRKGHARKLQKMISSLGIDTDCFMGSDKTVNYSCQVLIATYSKGGVGFDHPKLDMLIVGADVEENFMQYLGRVFRRDDTLPIYIDVRDNMTALATHSRTRIKVCEEVGANIYDFAKAFRNFEQDTAYIAP